MPAAIMTFLALTDKPLSHEKKMDLWLYIARALAEIDVTADILFKSFDEFSRDKGDTGKVTYYACKEGISI